MEIYNRGENEAMPYNTNNTKSVKMQSASKAGKFAAGNIFTGQFSKVDIASMGAELKWGVPFKCRPIAMKVRYKYNPQTIQNASGTKYSDQQGKADQCQILVSLTDWTEPFTVSTGANKFVEFDTTVVSVQPAWRERTELYGYFNEFSKKYTETDLRELLADESRPVWCAVEDGQFLGYCFCRVVIPFDSASVIRKELYIDDLCVDEDHRGSGIATKLFSHVRGYAAELGCTAITLNVWCGNASAMKFYEKMGMRQRSITMETKL